MRRTFTAEEKASVFELWKNGTGFSEIANILVRLQHQQDRRAGRVQCGPGETDMGRGQPGRSEAARRVRGGRIDGSRCPGRCRPG